MHTAEAVLNGHPDKLCDLIADKFLDIYLSHDPSSRVALEVQGGHGFIRITGEVTSRYEINKQEAYIISNKVLDEFGTPHCSVSWNVVQQSPEIAAGVDSGGAGDSGIVIGYATSETSEMLPSELVYASRIARALAIHPLLGPDGKVQVTSGKEIEH